MSLDISIKLHGLQVLCSYLCRSHFMHRISIVNIPSLCICFFRLQYPIINLTTFLILLLPNERSKVIFNIIIRSGGWDILGLKKLSLSYLLERKLPISECFYYIFNNSKLSCSCHKNAKYNLFKISSIDFDPILLKCSL